MCLSHQFHMKNISLWLIAASISLGANSAGTTHEGTKTVAIKTTTTTSVTNTLAPPTIAINMGVPQFVIYTDASGKRRSVALSLCTSNQDTIKQIVGIDPANTSLVCASTVNEKSKVVAVAWKTWDGVKFTIQGTGTAQDGLTYLIDKNEGYIK